jgi:hypothetical protein
MKNKFKKFVLLDTGYVTAYFPLPSMKHNLQTIQTLTVDCSQLTFHHSWTVHIYYIRLSQTRVPKVTYCEVNRIIM